jgi:hypothetical protein
MKGVADYLNVPYHETLVEPTLAGDPCGGDSSYERYQGISQTPLGPNRINLTDREREIVGRSLNSVIEEFNYDL